MVSEDIQEQSRVVDILDKAFSRIDEIQSTAEKNLQEAFDLFQSLKIEYLSPKENWIHCELKDVCTFFNGKPHESIVDNEGQYVLVNSKFISSDMVVRKTVPSQLFPLFVDDIVMVMSDVPNGKALAKCQIIDKNDTYSLNQRICTFRDSKLPVRFLYYLIYRSPYLLAYNNGENQTNLRKNDITSMPIAFPNNSVEIDSITNRLDNLSMRCSLLQKNYQKTVSLCDDLKQSLLQKAFNGEL